MSNVNFHDSLYAPFGGFRLEQVPFSKIVLKKRWSSVVYCPDPEEREPGAMYPRAIEVLTDKETERKLLATFECYTYDQPSFPIYESSDYGKSWKLIGKVEDTKNGFRCRYQPHLYQLQSDCGKLRKGTVLCAGNIIPDDFSSTSLQLFSSTDYGRSWTFMSEIVNGGKAEVDPPSGKRPVWEPFLIDDGNGVLFCFYSDEQYAESHGYNQALLHKKSYDGGISWTEAKFDVAFPGGILRPGMPIITKTASSYVMVYEIVNQDRIPVYFRKSDSLDDWSEPDFIGNPIIASDGAYISGTPYVTWIPHGGEKGSLLATGRGFSHIMANSLAGEGFWEKQEKLLDADNQMGFTGYSQCIIPIKDGRQILNLCPINISDKRAMIASVIADVYALV